MAAPRRPARPPSRAELRRLLAGGDRRSIAGSARARARIGRRAAAVAHLAALAADPDPLVAMRALDLLDKLAHDDPQLVQPHRALLIGPLADSDRWEYRLQIVRALPRLTWTPGERRRVVAILTRDAEHPQLFVRAWAVDGLVALAAEDPALRPIAERALAELERSDRRALRTRARPIRERLAKT